MVRRAEGSGVGSRHRAAYWNSFPASRLPTPLSSHSSSRTVRLHPRSVKPRLERADESDPPKSFGVSLWLGGSQSSCEPWQKRDSRGRGRSRRAPGTSVRLPVRQPNRGEPGVANQPSSIRIAATGDAAAGRLPQTCSTATLAATFQLHAFCCLELPPQPPSKWQAGANVATFAAVRRKALHADLPCYPTAALAIPASSGRVTQSVCQPPPRSRKARFRCLRRAFYASGLDQITPAAAIGCRGPAPRSSA